MQKSERPTRALLFAFCILHFAFAATAAHAAWFKGNTHTHTTESDGESSPADNVRWYEEHAYDFLVITDHDKITRVEGTRILLIPGEEVTDRLKKKPIHLCAIGIDEPVKPQGGTTTADVLQRDVKAIKAAGGLAAINHPNFGWAFDSKDLLQVEDFDLLEIASGHPYVNMQGPPSVESMWDALLTAGRRVWGIGVDDSHHLNRVFDSDVALPGKAWIVVRADRWDRASIVGAIRRGDFYASTGVELVDYTVANRTITVTTRVKNLAHYTTQFIGTNGRVLRETADNPAQFKIPAGERYVRAKVIDSNGRMAWCQPVFN